MSTLPAEKHPDPWLRRLYLPAYSVVDAARFARAKPQTVSYWHNSYARVGPVLPGKDRGAPLSYLQLVEVAFVATFRSLGVSLQRIHNARDYLAQTFQTEHPFAELRLKTEGKHVLLELSEVDRDAEIGRLIVADEAGQIAWKDLVSDRFAEFVYEEGLALRWHVRGPDSPIVIDPRVSFGAPTIRGVPTWAIKGRALAGESGEDIQEDFGLEADEIVQALEFEGL